jgi:hypothetical protein
MRDGQADQIALHWEGSKAMLEFDLQLALTGRG